MGRYWILLAVAMAATLTIPVAVVIVAPSGLPGQATPEPRLLLTVATDKATYAPGQAVLISLTVKNAGDGIARLLFGSTCQASYTVTAADGSTVYDYREHAGCGQVFTNLSLKPGDSKLYPLSWNQVTDEGSPIPTFRSYSIHGLLLTLRSPIGPSNGTTLFVTGQPLGPALAFAARTDRATYRPGDSANVTVILTNIGVEPVEMHFPTPCFVQFFVLDESRMSVYNSSKWWACVQVLTDVILAPGQSRNWTFRWDLRSDNGSPLAIGQSYQVVPSFFWAYADPYQRYVSRTDVATFAMVP